MSVAAIELALNGWADVAVGGDREAQHPSLGADEHPSHRGIKREASRVRQGAHVLHGEQPRRRPAGGASIGASIGRDRQAAHERVLGQESDHSDARSPPLAVIRRRSRSVFRRRPSSVVRRLSSVVVRRRRPSSSVVVVRRCRHPSSSSSVVRRRLAMQYI